MVTPDSLTSKTSGLRPWLLAARPKTLPAGACPVVLGATLAYADGVFHGLAVCCALAGALLIQIGTNYANDYFDFVKGTDTADRTGPTRATQAGWVTPRAMKTTAALVFALAFVPGAYLVYRGGFPILIIGVISVACGVLYTGGPLPLGYLGLGDLFVLVFFGPVAVAGTYYVQTLEWGSNSVILGFAAGLFSTAILTVNNLRDIEGDARSGKRSLAVRFGAGFARLEFLFCLLFGAVAIPLWLCLRNNGHWPAMTASLTLPAAIPAIRAVYSQSGSALNDTLARTGKLLLLFTVLFSLGWLL